MKTIGTFLIVAGIVSLASMAGAEHEKTCKNVHGKLTVITSDAIAVNDKTYNVGKSTRVIKSKEPAKLSQLTVGDVVCVDTRGKDDLEGEVAAVIVLSPSDTPVVREKEYVREQRAVRTAGHDKSCDHVHGKVSRVEESVLFVEGKPYAFREKTTILKGDEKITIEKVKSGDFVCLDREDEPNGKVTSMTVLSPTDAEQFESREVIREREKVREKIREEK